MPDDDEAVAFLREHVAQPPFHVFLQPVVDGWTPDPATARLRFALRPELCRAPGIAHGGVIAACVDVTGHAALFGQIRRLAPTIDMRVDYLRPGRSDLQAVGTVLRAGRTVAVVDVRITGDDGALVAAGRCLFSTKA